MYLERMYVKDNRCSVSNIWEILKIMNQLLITTALLSYLIISLAEILLKCSIERDNWIKRCK